MNRCAAERALLVAVHAGLALVLLTPLVWAPEAYHPFAVGKAVYARSLIAVTFALVGAARAVDAALASAAERHPRRTCGKPRGGRPVRLARRQSAAQPVVDLLAHGGARGQRPLVRPCPGARRDAARRRWLEPAAQRQPRRGARRRSGDDHALPPARGPDLRRVAAGGAIPPHQRHHRQSDLSRRVHAGDRAARGRVPRALLVRHGDAALAGAAAGGGKAAQDQAAGAPTGADFGRPRAAVLGRDDGVRALRADPDRLRGARWRGSVRARVWPRRSTPGSGVRRARAGTGA